MAVEYEKDLAFLAGWIMSRDTGASSDALVAHVFGGVPLGRRRPHDPGDLGRCLRATLSAPAHRRKAMAKQCVIWHDQLRAETHRWFNEPEHMDSWVRRENEYEQVLLIANGATHGR